MYTDFFYVMGILFFLAIIVLGVIIWGIATWLQVKKEEGSFKKGFIKGFLSVLFEKRFKVILILYVISTLIIIPVILHKNLRAEDLIEAYHEKLASKSYMESVVIGQSLDSLLQSWEDLSQGERLFRFNEISKGIGLLRWSIVGIDDYIMANNRVKTGYYFERLLIEYNMMTNTIVSDMEKGNDVLVRIGILKNDFALIKSLLEDYYEGKGLSPEDIQLRAREILKKSQFGFPGPF